MNIFNKYLKKLKINMLVVALLLSVSAYSQITVTGTITNESKETLMGVTVAVKGTSTGTITDIDGKFSINMPKGDTVLIFSYVGYESKEITIGEDHEIRVTMVVSENMLKGVEIVAEVGYGKQRVKDMTGSATVVNVEELIQTPGISIIDALAGQVVGLNVTEAEGRPGSVGSLTIRQPLQYGAGSVNVGNWTNPLIVIDDVVQVNTEGQPTYGMLNQLDFSEIESLTVLRDAEAAVYGSRGSNGAIVIKTKRGKAGKTTINYSTRLEYQDVVSHVKVMDAYETGLFYNRMLMTEYHNSLAEGGSTDNRQYMYSGEELMQMKSMNYDWLDKAWNPAISKQHNLNITGGTETVTFFSSLNYDDPGNNLGKVQDYDRWTFRAGGTANVLAGLKLSASVSGNSSNQVTVNNQAKMGRGPWGSSNGSEDYILLRHMPKYIPVTQLLPDPATGEMTEYYVSPWQGARHIGDNHTDQNLGDITGYNFFANEDSKSRKTNASSGWNANFSGTYEVPFLRGLTLKANYSLSNSSSRSNALGDYYTIVHPYNMNLPGQHLIGDYTNWQMLHWGDPNTTVERDPVTGKPNDSQLDRKPTISWGESTDRSYQMDFMLIYNRTFGKHDIALTAVFEKSEGEGNDISVQHRGLNISYNGTSSTASDGFLDINDSRTGTSKNESGSMGYVGRLFYKYDRRYILESTVRVDYSTKFAPENYMATFPTVGASWMLSEEKFYQNSKLADYISYLKLRASMGKTGRDNANAWMWLLMYQTTPTGGYGFGDRGGLGTTGASTPNQNSPNRDLKWDESIKQNYGVDFSMLRDRLFFTVEYWRENATGLVMDVVVPGEPIYIGKPTMLLNYGKKDGWGWEFSLGWADKINQSLLPSWGPIRYSFTTNYSISWTYNVLGNEPVFGYPEKIKNDASATGWRNTDGGIYGLRTWKQTSSGDGMLRTQADIDAYWQYLTDLAVAALPESADPATAKPEYRGIVDKSKMRLGMLAYEDVRGDLIDTNGDGKLDSYGSRNGRIPKDGDNERQDYVQLANNIIHNIPLNLNLFWGSLSVRAQLSTSWGGAAFIDMDQQQKYGADDMMWAQYSYMNDMFDPIENTGGKFPSMQVGEAYGVQSDFWMVPTFRCYVRNLMLSYSLPKNILKKSRLGIEKLSVSLTGTNLWDLYNPYPDHYRNMYDAGSSYLYPTLRTWTFGISASF